MYFFKGSLKVKKTQSGFSGLALLCSLRSSQSERPRYM